MGIIQTSKNQSIEAAINDYSRLILTICYTMTGDRFEAEDLTQETFVSAYANLDRFDGINMKAWLARIASNKCKDYLKSAARRIIPSSNEAFGMVKDQDPLPEEVLLHHDAKEQMLALCEKLNEPYKTISKEHFCNNKSAQEIAENTEKNIKTIQTQIYRAKAMLQKLWKEEYS